MKLRLVDIGILGVATVFGTGTCPVGEVVWLFGETNFKSGCTQLRVGTHIKVRLIYSNGQIGYEKWLVEQENGDLRLKRTDGFYIRGIS